jgi:transglutaminase-like putative cysteine protease
MLLRIDHETRLTYSAPVTESVIETRTAPPTQDDQTVLGYKLRVTPPAPVTAFRDGFGNKVELFNLLNPHTEVIIRAAACVRVQRQPATEQIQSVPWESEVGRQINVMEFLRPSPQVDFAQSVREFADAIKLEDSRSLQETAELIMRAIRTRLCYEKQVTKAHTKVSESLELGRGVCQDFTHLYLAVARLRGIPARYISGYIHQPGELATHAWVQLWAGPNAGWVNLDPTHGKWVEKDHIVTAIGRDFSDVPPNRGVWKGDAAESIAVTVNVQPVERVPADLAEATDGTGWSSQEGGTGSGHNTQSQNQQSRNRAFRQQQSQQQQT